MRANSDGVIRIHTTHVFDAWKQGADGAACFSRHSSCVCALDSIMCVITVVVVPMCVITMIMFPKARERSVSESESVNTYVSHKHIWQPEIHEVRFVTNLKSA